MNLSKIKKLYTSGLLLIISVTNLFGHKTGYKHNHGGGQSNVPEIDGNSIGLVVTIIGSMYLLYYYWKKSHTTDIKT